MKKTLIIINLLIICTPIFCQSPHWVWAKNTSCGSAEEDNYIKNISYDIQGNIYVTGFCDSCNFGNVIINPYAESLVNFIVKINSSGTVMWTKATKDIVIGSEMTDSLGHIYITGWIGIDTAYIGSDTIYLNKAGLFIGKLDSSGSKIWIQIIPGSICVNDIGIYCGPYLKKDIFNNLYLFGEGNNLNFGNFVLNDIIDGDLFLAKFDSSGNIKWAKGVGKYTRESTSLTIDNNSNIYVTGETSYNNNLILIGNDSLKARDGLEFVAKYDSSSNLLWARNFNVPPDHPEMSSGLDSKGDYYLTGSHYNDSLLFNGSYIDCGSEQMYLLKFDPSGKEIWARSTYQYLNESTIHDTIVQPTGLFVDKNNNIYITGYYKRMIIGNDTLLTNQSYDIFLVKYDSSGTIKWVTTVGGDSSDFSYCITTDLLGNIYIGGDFVSDSIKFGNTTLYNSHIGWYRGIYDQGLNNLFFAKLSDSNAGIPSISDNEEIKIYPNPTSSIFNVLLPEQTKNIRIYNSLGITIVNKPINKQSSQSFTLNQPGIYIVQVETDIGVITKKVIVIN